MLRGRKRRSKGLLLAVGVAIAGAGAGCHPDPKSGSGPGDDTDKAEQQQPICDVGPSPLRRMTKREYDRTVHDLLGDDTQPARSFPDEEEALGFKNNADAQSTSPVLVEKYLSVAEEVSARAVKNLPQWLQCDVAAKGEQACARAFVETFGKRAFRRPLTDADVQDLLAVYQAGRADSDHLTALSMVMETILMSPEFLYRIERGTPVADEAGIAQLDDYEIASRLSYFLWGSTPDDALMAAADAHQLQTPEQIEAQARRMVQDPRALDTLHEFHAQWLGLEHIDDLVKDPQVFPDFDPAIRPQLRAEADAFIDDVMRGPADLKTLLTAKYTYLNGSLAQYYGISGVQGEALQKVARPAERSAGLLSQGGVLAVHAHPNQTSPVLRGKFVREQFLCMAVPPPPEGVVITPPEPDKNATTRERFAQHRANAACAACHTLMDPIGFGFEKFDALGRPRDAENGVAIDDSGEVTGLGADGTFRGIGELGDKLASSPVVQQCVARQWFRFAQGRAELSGDLCTLESLQKQFADSGLRIPDLMVAITRTRPFRFRTDSNAAGGGK